jgi:hypothetical protein
VNWTQLLQGEFETAYATTQSLLEKVDPDTLLWKPATGENWMTVGQLLKHLSNACGAGCQAFLTGDWGLPEGVKIEDLTPEQLLPPAADLPAIDSVQQARGLLVEDKALALRMLARAGELELADRQVAAPWSPGVVRPLGWHFWQMVRHLEAHKAQLFYYLKLQGKHVSTADLWGPA